MPKNNGKARKAWRREAAMFNADFWERIDPAHLVIRSGPMSAYLFSKPYVRTNRPVKPNTGGN
jgi:hypothetical protein